MKADEIRKQNNHYLSPVTYVPNHVNGNAGHKDCEKGVIMQSGPYPEDIKTLRVLFCNSRTVQTTPIHNLTWG